MSLDQSKAPQDLTEVGGTGGRDETPPPLREESFNQAREQENVRGKIAIWLVGTFVSFIAIILMAVMATHFWCAYNDHCGEAVSDLKAVKFVVELILTPLVGLVGALTGFYFGEKSVNGGR